MLFLMAPVSMTLIFWMQWYIQCLTLETRITVLPLAFTKNFFKFLIWFLELFRPLSWNKTKLLFWMLNFHKLCLSSETTGRFMLFSDNFVDFILIIWQKGGKKIVIFAKNMWFVCLKFLAVLRGLKKWCLFVWPIVQKLCARLFSTCSICQIVFNLN